MARFEKHGIAPLVHPSPMVRMRLMGRTAIVQYQSWDKGLPPRIAHEAVSSHKHHAYWNGGMNCWEWHVDPAKTQEFMQKEWGISKTVYLQAKVAEGIWIPIHKTTLQSQ